MPQLDFSVFPSQLFWLLISFFLMLFLFSRFIIPKTAEMINLRKQKIDGDLEKAAELKQKVADALEKYNQALKDATAKAQLSLQKTKDELNDTINRRQTDLNNRLKQEIEAGEQKIAAAQDKTMQKIDGFSAELAVVVLKKLGFSGVTVSQAEKTISALKKD